MGERLVRQLATFSCSRGKYLFDIIYLRRLTTEARLGKKNKDGVLTSLPAPSPWPGADARLLGVGAGLPIDKLARLATFSADDFERFTLEWASDYLGKTEEIFEVQWRGGAGDKGRDVIAWLDAPDVKPRRWRLYQCKRYDANLGLNKAGVEIAKMLYYTFIGDYTVPESYHFVTHRGVTSPFQDLLDDPEKLKAAMLSTWNEYASGISSSAKMDLNDSLTQYIKKFDFSIFRAKQPIELINEHAETKYHLVVFGAPLIDRAPPPQPPSVVAAAEARYIAQLYAVISSHLQKEVQCLSDFETSKYHVGLFKRSRLTFYSAEGLFELARDQFSSTALFDSLVDEFEHGLVYSYTEPSEEPIERLKNTVMAAQSLQLGAHALAPHMNSKDREGMCHQLANKDIVDWCAYD
ncbi:ABC-three component system protein [Pseudoduganella sp. UC29_106]|uniref:ABC-three component system protein n=1 Tax=Pseudoduganella sp. UC29_106 TaxID=3374553 RepID=UPI0037565D60